MWTWTACGQTGPTAWRFKLFPIGDKCNSRAPELLSISPHNAVGHIYVLPRCIVHIHISKTKSFSFYLSCLKPSALFQETQQVTIWMWGHRSTKTGSCKCTFTGKVPLVCLCKSIGVNWNCTKQRLPDLTGRHQDTDIVLADPSVDYYRVRWTPEYCGHNHTKAMEKITTQVGWHISHKQDELWRPLLFGSIYNIFKSLKKWTFPLQTWHMLNSSVWFSVVWSRSRRALPASRTCCSPASIKSFCSPWVKGLIHPWKVPASLPLPVPPSKPRVQNPSCVREKKVRWWWWWWWW